MTPSSKTTGLTAQELRGGPLPYPHQPPTLGHHTWGFWVPLLSALGMSLPSDTITRIFNHTLLRLWPTLLLSLGCRGGCLVDKLCLTLCNLMDYSPPGSVHGISWGRLPFPSPRDPPDAAIKPMSPASPALQVDLLLSHQGRPSLSLGCYVTPNLTSIPRYALLDYSGAQGAVWVMVIRF